MAAMSRWFRSTFSPLKCMFSGASGHAPDHEQISDSIVRACRGRDGNHHTAEIVRMKNDKLAIARNGCCHTNTR